MRPLQFPRSDDRQKVKSGVKALQRNSPPPLPPSSLLTQFPPTSSFIMVRMKYDSTDIDFIDVHPSDLISNLRMIAPATPPSTPQKAKGIPISFSADASNFFAINNPDQT